MQRGPSGSMLVMCEPCTLFYVLYHMFTAKQGSKRFEPTGTRYMWPVSGNVHMLHDTVRITESYTPLNDWREIDCEAGRKHALGLPE